MGNKKANESKLLFLSEKLEGFGPDTDLKQRYDKEEHYSAGKYCSLNSIEFMETLSSNKYFCSLVP